MSLNSSLHRFRDVWNRFVQGPGFALIVTACVAIVTGAAVWAKEANQPYIAPTPPVSYEHPAASLVQESLRDAATPSPAPTIRPIAWQQPLSVWEVCQPYSDVQMVQSGITGVWALHDAVDLKVAAGEPVYAIADGTIVDCGEDALLGCWIRIRHEQGYTSEYAGLSMLSAIRAGDPVKAGHTIGFAGKGPLTEQDLPAHLHLRLTQDGRALDPRSQLESAH